MIYAELRAAMIERFERVIGQYEGDALAGAMALELVDNALAMMPDRAGEFPVGSPDESGRLVTYERRFTVRVAVPQREDLHTSQRARVDIDLDGHLLNSIKVDSNTEAIGEATREVLQQLIADAPKMGIDPATTEV